MYLPPDLEATVRDINKDFKIRNIDAILKITSYNQETGAFTYDVQSNDFSVLSRAHEIADKHIKLYRNSKPSFTLYRR